MSQYHVDSSTERFIDRLFDYDGSTTDGSSTNWLAYQVIFPDYCSPIMVRLLCQIA